MVLLLQRVLDLLLPKAGIVAVVIVCVGGSGSGSGSGSGGSLGRSLARAALGTHRTMRRRIIELVLVVLGAIVEVRRQCRGLLHRNNAELLACLYIYGWQASG